MASITDLKKFFEKSQGESAPNDVSIVKYFQINGVVYSQFEKRYKYSRWGVIRRFDFETKCGMVCRNDRTLVYDRSRKQDSPSNARTDKE